MLVFATEPAAGTSSVFTIVYIVILAAMFYFLFMRPNKKQKQERANLMNSLAVGDEIFTAGGILGSITRIKEHTVWVRISEKCEIELLKTSIGGRNTQREVPEPEIKE
ncbi:MAG: preprotein translocase subunit YajC [Firmicutes bacterium]|nr:preprotein translocase subunit YajC [Bacillota bacterium]